VAFNLSPGGSGGVWVSEVDYRVGQCFRFPVTGSQQTVTGNLRTLYFLLALKAFRFSSFVKLIPQSRDFIQNSIDLFFGRSLLALEKF